MAGKQPKGKERPGVDRMGRTPLHYAALEGKAGNVRQLLASGWFLMLLMTTAGRRSISRHKATLPTLLNYC